MCGVMRTCGDDVTFVSIQRKKKRDEGDEKPARNRDACRRGQSLWRRQKNAEK